MNLRMLVGGAMVAGALVAGTGVASAAVPAEGARTVVAAASGCWKRPALSIGSTVYAYATGGCSTVPSTVTVYLYRNGIQASRATCNAPRGGSCFVATPRVVFQPGVDYRAI